MNKKAIMTIGILIGIFVLPFYLAYHFYFHANGMFSLKNRGTLLQPAVQLKKLNLVHRDGKGFKSDPEKPIWSIMYLRQQACDESCKRNLYKINQLWVALGADHDRVQRILITTAQQQQHVFNKFVRKYYHRVHLLLIPQKNLQWLADKGAIFIMDPRGLIILAYPEDAPPDDIYDDLKRLLKVSQIG